MMFQILDPRLDFNEGRYEVLGPESPRTHLDYMDS